MREPFTQLYLHLCWATWDRLPFIQPQTEAKLYASIAEKCRSLDCVPLVIGGTEDHVHLLIRISATVSVAMLVKEVKGTSSHFMTHVVTPADAFKWQGGYGAFTLRKSDVPDVKAYIERQKEHHATGDLWNEWEHTSIEGEVKEPGG